MNIKRDFLLLRIPLALAYGLICIVLIGCGKDSNKSSTPTPSPPAVTAPTITAQPASQTVTAGSSATFSVTASGTAPLSYQWRRNGTAINGATSASYRITTTATTDNGVSFSVVVSNTAGIVPSNSATLSVNPATGPGAVITTQPGSRSQQNAQRQGFDLLYTRAVLVKQP